MHASDVCCQAAHVAHISCCIGTLSLAAYAVLVLSWTTSRNGKQHSCSEHCSLPKRAYSMAHQLQKIHETCMHACMHACMNASTLCYMHAMVLWTADNSSHMRLLFFSGAISSFRPITWRNRPQLPKSIVAKPVHQQELSGREVEDTCLHMHASIWIVASLCSFSWDSWFSRKFPCNTDRSHWESTVVSWALPQPPGQFCNLSVNACVKNGFLQHSLGA